MKSNESCIKCAGTKKMANGDPCPICCKDDVETVPIVFDIPAQYQGVRFDKNFLPDKEQKSYGVFMEELLTTIINDLAFYQKNLLICSRPNSGKTVWSYSLYSIITSKGYEMPPIKDLVEVRSILNSYSELDKAQLYSTARCAVIRIPRDVQFWMFDTISYILERRVRSGGFTIFMFAGTIDELRQVDKYDRLKHLDGTGAYNTVEVKSF